MAVWMGNGGDGDVPILDPSSAAKDSASSLAWAKPGILSSASLPSSGLSHSLLAWWPSTAATAGSGVPLVVTAVAGTSVLSCGVAVVSVSGASALVVVVVVVSSVGASGGWADSGVWLVSAVGVSVDSEGVELVGSVEAAGAAFSVGVGVALVGSGSALVPSVTAGTLLSLLAFCCMSCRAAIFMKSRYLRHKTHGMVNGQHLLTLLSTMTRAAPLLLGQQLLQLNHSGGRWVSLTGTCRPEMTGNVVKAQTHIEMGRVIGRENKADSAFPLL